MLQKGQEEAPHILWSPLDAINPPLIVALVQAPTEENEAKISASRGDNRLFHTKTALWLDSLKCTQLVPNSQWIYLLFLSEDGHAEQALFSTFSPSGRVKSTNEGLKRLASMSP